MNKTHLARLEARGEVFISGNLQALEMSREIVVHVEGATIAPETLYQGDYALSTNPVMHYQSTAYLCYKGACQSTQGVGYGHRLQCHLSAGIDATQISIT